MCGLYLNPYLGSSFEMNKRRGDNNFIMAISRISEADIGRSNQQK